MFTPCYTVTAHNNNCIRKVSAYKLILAMIKAQCIPKNQVLVLKVFRKKYLLQILEVSKHMEVCGSVLKHEISQLESKRKNVNKSNNTLKMMTEENN